MRAPAWQILVCNLAGVGKYLLNGDGYLLRVRVRAILPPAYHSANCRLQQGQLNHAA